MKVFFKLLLMTVVMTACSSGERHGDIPEEYGDIAGTVHLYDDLTHSVEAGGMKVTVEGTSPEISTQTELNGRFRLTHVPPGTYRLRFEKSGYGTFIKESVEHVRGELLTFVSGLPSLGAKSTTGITKLSSIAEVDQVKILAETDPEAYGSNRRYLRFFYSTNKDVSHQNYRAYSETQTAQINPFEWTVKASDLYAMGFKKGETVFARAYGDSFFSNKYHDVKGDKMIFPNLNAQTVEAVSFIVP